MALAGGGTGGHIFPALAVAEALRGMGPTHLVWIGSRSRQDRAIVEERGIPYCAIPAGRLRRFFSLRNALDAFKVLGGIAASIRVLLRTRPDVLFSKGGFVSVPPTLAAWLLRIPVVSHECDLTPGLATRINAPFSRRIHVSFPETVRYLGRAASRARLSGNPVRAEIGRGDGARARAVLGVPAGVPVILIVGGSGGAAALNRAVSECLPRLAGRYFVIHQHGRGTTASARARYHPAAFFGADYPDLLDAADLVVCRAGANTLSELSARGKPAILVPLPRTSSRGDQITNAAHRERLGAALVLNQNDLTGERLAGLVEALTADRGALESMARISRSLAQPDAAQVVARDVMRVARGDRGP